MAQGRTVPEGAGVAESSGRLAGNGALITGASSGIGEATARAFVREGARLAGSRAASATAMLLL